MNKWNSMNNDVKTITVSTPEQVIKELDLLYKCAQNGAVNLDKIAKSKGVLYSHYDKASGAINFISQHIVQQDEQIKNYKKSWEHHYNLVQKLQKEVVFYKDGQAYEAKIGDKYGNKIYNIEERILKAKNDCHNEISIDELENILRSDENE